jgi:cytochrome c5
MRRIAIWCFALGMIAVMALPAAAQRGGGRRQVELPNGPARKVILKSCTVCHGLDPYATRGMDRAGWEQLVASMKAKGAVISSSDESILLDYLASTFGPNTAPQRGQTAAAAAPLDPAVLAKGKELLEGACMRCHSLQRIESQSNTEDAWDNIVRNMINRGARVADGDVQALVQFLGRTYGPK